MKTTIGLSLLTTLILGACSDQPAPALPPAQAAQPAQTSPAAAVPAGNATSGTTPAAADSSAPKPVAPGAATAANSPPVSITSVRAQQRDLPVFLQAPGTVTPVSNVDIRAQVNSVVTRVHIKEGQFVSKGDVLFTLDARADEANVAKARAQLAKDQAALADAQRQLARSKQLVERNFVSQGAVDSAQAQVDAQTAAVAADKAAVDAARVPLSYSRIVAPGSGRVGTIAVFAGSSVQANQTPMTTLTQLDPINVSFNLPQRNLGSVLGILKAGGAQVKATLPEKGATLNGRLSFVDTTVDANSGTVKAKAVFDNKGTPLWPGAFLNISVQIDTLKEAIVVPQASIVQTVRGSIVYVIDKDNKAAIRPVTIVLSQGEEAAVTGVKAGERLALEGRQNLRPGATAIERPRDPAGRPQGKAGERKSDGPAGKAAEKEADKGAEKVAEKGPGKGTDNSVGKSAGSSAEKSPDKGGADKSGTEKSKP